MKPWVFAVPSPAPLLTSSLSPSDREVESWEKNWSCHSYFLFDSYSKETFIFFETLKLSLPVATAWRYCWCSSPLMFLTASWSAQPHWACCPTPGPRSWAGWRSWCRGAARCLCPRHSSWWSLSRVTLPPHRTPAGTWGSGRWPGAWTSQSWTWGQHHVTLLMKKTYKWKIILVKTVIDCYC